MKITSINFIDTASLPKVQMRDTQRKRDVATILENLGKAAPGKSLVISAQDMKKFERYQLQKALQRAGAKALVLAGPHPTTGVPSLFVKKLTDAEWREWESQGVATTKSKSKK